MVMNTCNPASWEKEVEGLWFEASLGKSISSKGWYSRSRMFSKQLQGLKFNPSTAKDK
jgi:hypothetical protein